MAVLAVLENRIQKSKAEIICRHIIGVRICAGGSYTKVSLRSVRCFQLPLDVEFKVPPFLRGETSTLSSPKRRPRGFSMGRRLLVGSLVMQWRFVCVTYVHVVLLPVKGISRRSSLRICTPLSIETRCCDTFTARELLKAHTFSSIKKIRLSQQPLTRILTVVPYETIHVVFGLLMLPWVLAYSRYTNSKQRVTGKHEYDKAAEL